MPTLAEPSLDAIRSPFQELRDLLGDEAPGAPPIDMTVGEPRHGFPAFARAIIDSQAASFGRYPPIAGIPELRRAIARWLCLRYALPQDAVDPDRNIVPLCGTREGLVSALSIAAARKAVERPAVLMPNPFYQAYYAAAWTARCEAVPLAAGAETGFLPDLEALSPELLDRAVAFYLASPANPQGAVASKSYLRKLVTLARAHSFYVFADECYSEIYETAPPEGALAAAFELDRGFANVAVFNSLSKRSNAPGLRSGFIAGDTAFLAAFLKYRNVAAPQIPIPIQYASAALWADEAHVEESRALYRTKFEVARAALSRFPGFRRPDGGFFLWLNLSNLGGGEAAAKTIWKGCGVKILPGSFLAQTDASGLNPARDYARLALVDPVAVTQDACNRLGSILL